MERHAVRLHVRCGSGIQRPGWQTVGTFYEMQLQVKQSVGGMTGWNVRLDSLYEDQISIPAGYDETTRWTRRLCVR